MPADLPRSVGPRPPVLLALAVLQGLIVLLMATATSRGLDLGGWMDTGPGDGTERRSGWSRPFRWFHK